MTGIEWVYIAAVVASAAVGGYSSYQAGKAQEEQAEYQSQIAHLNARMAGQEADNEASMLRARYRRLRGSQTASAAKAGVTIDGSTTDIFNDTNIQEDLDVMATLYKGKQTTLGEKFKEDLFINQGKNARKQGNLNAAGAVIGAGMQGYANYPTVN